MSSSSARARRLGSLNLRRPYRYSYTQFFPTPAFAAHLLRVHFLECRSGITKACRSRARLEQVCAFDMASGALFPLVLVAVDSFRSRLVPVFLLTSFWFPS